MAVVAPVVDEAIIGIVIRGVVSETLYVEHDAVACHDVLLLLSKQSVLLFWALNQILFRQTLS